MAGKGGFTYEIGADASGFISQAKRAGTAADEFNDSLDDVAKQAKETNSSLDKSMDNVSTDVKAAADDLESKFSTAFDSVKRESKTVGDDIGSHVKRGAKDADEGVKALKENTASNAKEMGGSFQDVQSALDGIQGLASEALEGFGPAGVAAGVAVAAGIGIAQQALQKAADRVNQIKTDAVALAIEMKNATSADEVKNLQGRWDDLMQTIVDNKSWFEPWQREAKTALDAVAAAVKTDRLDVKAFMDAFDDPNPVKRADDMASALAKMKDKSASLGEQIRDLTDRQQKYGESATRGIVASDKWTDADDRALESAKAQKAALDGATGALQQSADTANQAAEEYRAMADLQGLTVDQYRAQQDAAQAAADAQAAAVDKAKQAMADQQAALESEDEAYRSSLASMADVGTLLGDAWNDPNSSLRKWAEGQAKATKAADDTWQDFQDKATPAQAVDAVLQQMEAKIAQNAKFEENLADLGRRGFGALAEQLRQGGPEANGAIVAGLAQATDAKVQQFATDQGTLLGKNLIQGSAAGFSSDPALQNAVNSAVSRITPPNVAVTARLKVDDSEVQAWLAKPRQFTAGVMVRPGQVQWG